MREIYRQWCRLLIPSFCPFTHLSFVVHSCLRQHWHGLVRRVRHFWPSVVFLWHPLLHIFCGKETKVWRGYLQKPRSRNLETQGTARKKDSLLIYGPEENANNTAHPITWQKKVELLGLDGVCHACQMQLQYRPFVSLKVEGWGTRPWKTWMAEP